VKRAGFVLALAIAGCAEQQGVTPATTGTAPKQIVPAVAITDSSTPGQVVLTLQLRASWPMQRVGSFTGRLTFDSTTLRFTAEEPVADGALRALNPASPGVVRVAGAAASGMAIDRLIALRFQVLDRTDFGKAATIRAALLNASFEIAELHEVTSNDVSAMIVRPSAVAPPVAKP